MTTHKDGWMLSRREFAAVPALVVGAAAGALAQRALLTAGEVIDRIKANLGVPWRGGPTDTFKSGDVDTPIAGIAATVMSTFDVIKRAAAARKNMVITHEPTYWLGNDDVRSFTNDALYQKKLQFIRDNNIVVWRFHDHLHARQPDMSAVGLADAIGWSKYQSKDDPRVYVLPRLSLRDLAKEVGTNGSLYRVAKPIVNVSRAPNDWQTFDIIQHAPTCCNGALTSPGDITLIHNGVLVLDRPARPQRSVSARHDGNERPDHVAGSRSEWADDGHALPQHLVQTADADEVKATYELRDPIKAL